MPGRGGISRGPGHATLEYNHQTAGEIENLKVERLPPGRVPGRDWELMSVRRSQPRVEPERAGTVSGTVTVEGPGAATFRRRLAPRHRDAVQRFFSETPKANR
jgi:hypothetical protein